MQAAELKRLAEQLRCPSGEFGVEMGRSMAVSNNEMTLKSIEALSIQNGDRVLELGHGICEHLAQMMQDKAKVRYQGLEISPLMQQQAMAVNTHLMAQQQVDFGLYDGVQIPFDNATFDKVLTVNTLYFWSPATLLTAEIARVLKPNGIAIITYAQKQFMKTLPFVGEQFQLYDNKDVAQLIKDVPLEIIESTDKCDRAISKSGEMVDREYTIAKLRKLDL